MLDIDPKGSWSFTQLIPSQSLSVVVFAIPDNLSKGSFSAIHFIPSQICATNPDDGSVGNLVMHLTPSQTRCVNSIAFAKYPYKSFIIPSIVPIMTT